MDAVDRGPVAACGFVEAAHNADYAGIDRGIALAEDDGIRQSRTFPGECNNRFGPGTLHCVAIAQYQRIFRVFDVFILRTDQRGMFEILDRIANVLVDLVVRAYQHALIGLVLRRVARQFVLAAQHDDAGSIFQRVLITHHRDSARAGEGPRRRRVAAYDCRRPEVRRVVGADRN